MPDSTLLDGRPLAGDDTVLIGTIIGNKYRVDRFLGKGGMGVVLAATHVVLQERVAIKTLHSSLVRDEDAVRRFLLEARAVRKLTSEHVVRVRDVDAFADGVPYIVMDLLEGEDLAARMNAERPAIGTAVGWIAAACEGIAEAHAHKIVHRDLKPANLFLAKTSNGETLKVLDFGVAKILEASARNQAETATNVAIGTPAYMAPEQHESSKRADERSDVWALGAVLYHLLVGRVPFQGETPQVTYALILSSVPKSPHLNDPQVPAALSDAVMRCLQRDPAARFQRVEDLRDAIAPFAGLAARTRSIVSAPEPAIDPGASNGGTLHSAEIFVERTPPMATRFRGPRASIVVAALAVSLVALGLMVAPASLLDRAPPYKERRFEPAVLNAKSLLSDPPPQTDTAETNTGATAIASASAIGVSSALVANDSDRRPSNPASAPQALARRRVPSIQSAHPSNPAPVASAAATASSGSVDDLYRHRQSF